MTSHEFEPRVVVIGGGNGTSALLEGMTHHTSDITALVNTVDNGGSSGALRSKYSGLVGLGDIRQCIRALSADPERAKELDVRDADGHATGNLALVERALVHGGPEHIEEAIHEVSEEYEVQGQVIPISLTNSHLVMLRDGKEVMRGEFEIAHSDDELWRPNVTLELSPDAQLNPRATRAIYYSDATVIAPGNFYGSIIPALLTNGLDTELADSTGKLIMVSNLINNYKTAGFTIDDYVRELERHTGINPDAVIAHGSALEKVDQVTATIGSPHLVVTGDVADTCEVAHAANDQIAAKRSRVRHNSHAVAELIFGQLQAA